MLRLSSLPMKNRLTFQLVPGLEIRLVASEPLVEEPVFITFDEDGRMWVAEMRGFMPIDGTGETDPIGRISIYTDEDGDGQMDTQAISYDNLVLPRSIAVVKGGALIAENIPLWYAEDTADGDLITRIANTQLTRPTAAKACPNIHPTDSGGTWTTGTTMPNPNTATAWWRKMDKRRNRFRGPWGISHDDAGRLYYNYNWSQLHADIAPPNYLSPQCTSHLGTGIDVGGLHQPGDISHSPQSGGKPGYVPGSLGKTAACWNLLPASRSAGLSGGHLYGRIPWKCICL
ncbi:MAG: hypothetical protein R3C61_22925 [Bacteroidia bacterium]